MARSPPRNRRGHSIAEIVVSPSTRKTAPGPNALSAIRSGQIRILFAAIPTSLLSILISSFLLVVVLLEVVDQIALIAWFCATNLLSLVRLYLYRQFRKLGEDRLIGDYWYRLAIVTSLASGATGGIASSASTFSTKRHFPS